METPSTTPQQSQGSPRARTMGGSLDTSGYLPPLEEQADALGATRSPQAGPPREHTIAAPLPVPQQWQPAVRTPVTVEDWASQAWINLHLIANGEALDEGRSTLARFLEQAPDRVALPAKATLGIAQPRRQPQLDDIVRVDRDRGMGIRRAIARVIQTGSGAVQVDIDGKGYWLGNDEVTVVRYDRETGTWDEVGVVTDQPVCNEPHLGLATTRQLLAEITTRIEVDEANGGGGLDYSTVKGRP